VVALEPNTTPDPGNGPSNTVAASATIVRCRGDNRCQR